ncbi:hypothetical protein Glove_174g139 [Diversispora epigaea]|uniref:Uncharacterized protein n=1 Tax=Diversispora epigaea TaxID=1348612 RepID=A0A397ITF7_9GLOM|nr:hypothetical protein Glove_174g139 [Diversispora epigaea]
MNTFFLSTTAGFEPARVNPSAFEADALDHSAMLSIEYEQCWSSFTNIKPKYYHTGFEPARVNPSAFEADALDHSAMLSIEYEQCWSSFTNIKPKYYHSMES